MFRAHEPKPQRRVVMATLTVDDAVLLKVDECAKEERISREDFVNRAISLYLHEKLMDELNAHGRRLGITEEIIAEEIKRSREERRRASA
jgi:metal-responsive CopG/Arc/MetJ family transcriptional regulator